MAMTYYDSVAVTPMRIELDNFSDSESKDIFVMIEVTGQQSSTRTIMEAQIVVSWQQQFVFAVTPEVKQRGKLGVYNFKTSYDQLLATCEFDIPHNWPADNAYKGLKLDLISPMTQHPCGLAYVFIQPAPAALQLKMPMSGGDMAMSKYTGPRPDKVCVNVFKATDVIGLNGQPGMYDAKVVVTVAENSLVTAEVRSFAIEPFWDSELVFPLPADCESFKVRLYEHDQILGEAEASLRGFLEDEEHYCCIEMRMISPSTGHQTAFLDIIVKEAPVAPTIEQQPEAPLQKKPALSGATHRIVDINVLQAQRLHMENGEYADRSMYSNLFVQMLLGEKDAQTNLGQRRDGMDGGGAHEVEVPMAIWKENFSMEVPMRTHDLMFILFDNSTSHPVGDHPTELGSAILNLPAAFPHHQVDTWLYILDPESKQTERAILRVALRFRWLDSCYPKWIIPEFYYGPKPAPSLPPLYFSMHPLPPTQKASSDWSNEREVFMLRVCVGHNFANFGAESQYTHSAGIEEAPPPIHKPFCIITINDQHTAQTRAFSAPRSWRIQPQGQKYENPYFPVWNADFYFELPKDSRPASGKIQVYSDTHASGHEQGAQSELIGQANLPLDKLMNREAAAMQKVSVEISDQDGQPLSVEMPWEGGVDRGVTKVHFTQERMTVDLCGLMHKPTLEKLIPQTTYTVEVVKGIDLKAPSWPPVNLKTEVARLALVSELSARKGDRFANMSHAELEQEARMAGIDPEAVVVAEEPVDAYVILTMTMKGGDTEAFQPGVKSPRQQFEQTNTVDGTSRIVEWKEKFEFEKPRSETELRIDVMESDLGDPVFIGYATLDDNQLVEIAKKGSVKLNLGLNDNRGGRSGELTIEVTADTQANAQSSDQYYPRMWSELKQGSAPMAAAAPRDIVLPVQEPQKIDLLRTVIKRETIGGGKDTNSDPHSLLKEYMERSGTKAAATLLILNVILFVLGLVTCILGFVMPASKLGDADLERSAPVSLQMMMKNGAAWGIFTMVMAIIGIIGALDTKKEWSGDAAAQHNDKISPGIFKLLVFFYGLLPVNCALLCSAGLLWLCKEVPKWGVERMQMVFPTDYSDLFENDSITDAQGTVSSNMTVVGVLCIVTWIWSCACLLFTWKAASPFHVLGGLTEAMNSVVVMICCGLMFAGSYSLNLSSFTANKDFTDTFDIEQVEAKVMIAILFFICWGIVTALLGIFAAAKEKRQLMQVTCAMHACLVIAGLVCGFGAFGFYYPEKAVQSNCGLMANIHQDWLEQFAACPKYNGKPTHAAVISGKPFTSITQVCPKNGQETVAWEQNPDNGIPRMGCMNYRCCGALLAQVRDAKASICVLMVIAALWALSTIGVTFTARQLLMNRDTDDNGPGKHNDEGFRHKFAMPVLAFCVVCLIIAIGATAGWMAANPKFETRLKSESEGDLSGQPVAEVASVQSLNEFGRRRAAHLACDTLNTDQYPEQLTIYGNLAGLDGNGAEVTIDSYTIQPIMPGCQDLLPKQVNAENSENVKPPQYKIAVPLQAARSGRLQLIFKAASYHDSSPVFLPARSRSTQILLPKIHLTALSAGTGWTVKGQIFDTVDFRPLPAEVRLCKALANLQDATAAECPMTVQSGGSGAYSFTNVPFPPPYVLLGSTTAAGMTGGSYFTTTKQLVGRPGQPQGTVGGFVPFTKALTQNQMQIVFTWQTMSSEANKAGVQDLQMHMTFQGSSERKCHLYAANPQCGNATLATNYISGGVYGMETITVSVLKKSKYLVWYSNKAARLGTQRFITQVSLFTSAGLTRTVGSNSIQSACIATSDGTCQDQESTGSALATLAAEEAYNPLFGKFVAMCIDATGTELTVSAIENYMAESDMPDCS
jgi:hypothetical protein